MKAKWIDEVREIVSGEQFASWFAALEESRRELKRANDRYEELLTQVNLLEFRAELAHRKAIDTLERANILDDTSASLANESAELENASFEVVSQYEMQRDRCTRLWEELGGIDVMIEEKPSEKAKLEKRRRRVNEEYEREDQRKQRLWTEVERLWVRSIDCNLALHEKKQKAGLVRAEAERLFLLHENEATQAGDLKAQAEKMAVERDAAEQAVNDSCEGARREYECLLTEDFLYWVAREDNKVVYVVPLIEDASNYEIPVMPSTIYKCDHQTGVDSLEPLDDAPASAEAGDDAPESDDSAADDSAADDAGEGGEGSASDDADDEASAKPAADAT